MIPVSHAAPVCEPLNDRGSRLSFHPRFAYPLWLLDRFELYPEIGYYETLYSSDRVGFAQRGLVTSKLKRTFYYPRGRKRSKPTSGQMDNRPAVDYKNLAEFDRYG